MTNTITYAELQQISDELSAKHLRTFVIPIKDVRKAIELVKQGTLDMSAIKWSDGSQMTLDELLQLGEQYDRLSDGKN